MENGKAHTFDPAARTTYSRQQISQYFDRIRLPEKYRSQIEKADFAKSTDSLPFLKALIRYQQSNIPFENLDLHYSQHKNISIDPIHVFHKIVERNAGRGGWCMENSCLFGTVLRSLGFDVMSTGARVNEAVQPQAGLKGWKGPRFDGWNHMVNIVTIDSQRYLVDVGFSSFNPTFPFALESGSTAENIKNGLYIKLDHTHIPDTTHNPHPLWVYSLRFNQEMDWLPGYCFSDAVEFLPRDFETMNFFVSKSPTSWFTQHVLGIKAIMADDGSEDIVGDITLFDKEIKERRGGKSELLVPEFQTEEERTDALEKYIGIRLHRPEVQGIAGTVAMLSWPA